VGNEKIQENQVTIPWCKELNQDKRLGVNGGLKGLSCQANNVGSLVGSNESRESQQIDWR